MYDFVILGGGSSGRTLAGRRGTFYLVRDIGRSFAAIMLNAPLKKAWRHIIDYASSPLGSRMAKAIRAASAMCARP